MTIDASFSNVLIEDNTFDFGTFSPDGNLLSTPTVYSYNTCVTTNADARIMDNYFAGVAASGTHLIISNISSVSGSLLITENTFVRNSLNISSYIDISNVLYDSSIVKNIFDSSTVDGTSENLVNLPTLSIGSLKPNIEYHSNKNQTAYLPVQKFPYLMDQSCTPSPNPSNYARYTSNNVANSYQSGPGIFTGVNAIYDKEGVDIKYTFPWNESNAISIPGVFTVTNGSTTVTVESQIAIPSINSLDTSFIVFGNEGVPYTISTVSSSALALGGGVSASVQYITSITINTAYTGLSAFATSGVIYIAFVDFGSNSHTPALATPLFGTFTMTNGSNAFTASSTQTSGITVGSLITFIPAASFSNSVYTIASMDSTGQHLTLTSNFSGPTGIYTASANTVTAFFNFSIDVAELLPPGVQILDFVVGVWGSGLANLVSVLYNAWSYCSAPGNYSPTSLTNSMADVKNFNINGQGWTNKSTTLQVNNPTAVGSGVSLATFNGATQYVLLDVLAGGSPGTPNNYFTGQGQVIRFNFNIILSMLTPCNAFIPESPLIIRYRW